MYQVLETLFDKLDSFGTLYTYNQKLFNNLPICDFDSIPVDEENFKDTNTTTWIGKRIPISLSTSSDLVQEPISPFNTNPRDLVSSFIEALGNLATQSKAQMKRIFFQLEIAIKSRVAPILETLNQRRSHCVGIQAEDDNSSTKFLQMQENQLIDLQEHFER